MALAFVFLLAEVWVLFHIQWQLRRRKITVISYVVHGVEIPDREHKPIRTGTISKDNGRIMPRDIDQGAFTVDEDEEGITWCWGWKQEDVDALVVAYSLR